MPLNIKFERDQSGVPRAQLDHTHNLLRNLLEGDIQDDIELAAAVLKIAKEVSTGERTEYAREYDLTAFALTVKNANITDTTGNARPLELPLNDFIDAIQGWYKFLLQDTPAPIALLLESMLLTDLRDTEPLYAQALPQLCAQPELAAPYAESMLCTIVWNLLEGKRDSEAEKWVELLHSTQEFGGSPSYLFSLANMYWELGMKDQAEEVLKRSVRWVPHFVIDEQRDAYVVEIGGYYADLLKELNREADLTTLFYEMEDRRKALHHISLELYRATGLYDEFVMASGAINMLRGLSQQIFAASGGAHGSQNPQTMVGCSKEELKSLLCASVHKNAQSTSLYNQIKEMQTDLEQSWQSMSQHESTNPEFYQLVQYRVDNLLSSMNEIKADENATFNATPPSATPLAAQSGATDPPGGTGNDLLGSIMSMLNIGAAPVRPGSPNAEPCTLWSQAKSTGLRFQRPEMANRLSKVGGDYIMNFHENQATALSRFADGIEHQFEERPHFIVECLTDLVRTYEKERRDNDVAMFKSRLEKYKNVDRQADDHLDMHPRGIGIYVPISCDREANTLNKLLKQAINRELVSISFSSPERHRAYPGKEFVRICLESDPMNAALDSARKVLAETPLPDGSFIEQNGKTSKSIP